MVLCDMWGLICVINMCVCVVIQYLLLMIVFRIQMVQ